MFAKTSFFKVPFFFFSTAAGTSSTSAYGRHFYQYPVLNLPIDSGALPYSHYISQSTPILADFRKNLQAILREKRADNPSRGHKKRQKMSIRERVTKLLDPGSPFLELSQFAGYKLYNEDLPSGGMVTGVGLIKGKWAMIVANDPTIKAGSLFPITIAKQIRAQEIAFENELPCVYLVDTAGAYLPMQDQVFPGKDHGGRLFTYMAKMSARGISQISIVLGLCAAGGSFISGM